MRISLNLATRPFADLGPALKRLRIAMAVLAVAAIGLGFGLRALHQKAEDARARDHSLDGQIAAITQERQGYQNLMLEPANAQLLVQVGALNQLFDIKSFSWTLAMEDLETVLPGGVQVSTLEPIRDKDGHITLHLRVLGPRDRALELVKILEHSKHFILPRIVGESAESTGGASQHLEPVSASNRVNFDLLADYNSASNAESKPKTKSEKPEAGSSTGQPNSAPRALRPGQFNPAPQPGRPPYTGSSRPHPGSNAGGPQ
jgi:type IV pilus assembly protein PilN